MVHIVKCNTCPDESACKDNEVKLTTFKKMEESIIEDKIAVVESTLNDDNAEKIPPSEVADTTAEKQDSTPNVFTTRFVLPSSEK